MERDAQVIRENLMNEKRIIFSSLMVRAILEGRKTQTRRVIRPQPQVSDRGCPSWVAEPGKKHIRLGPRRCGGGPAVTMHDLMSEYCPYGQPGDRLWVRETWSDLRGGGFNVSFAYKEKSLSRDGTHEDEEAKRCREDFGYKWKSPLFMPRAASRLTLELTDVRVEHVQDISQGDAQAEGVEHDNLVGYYCDEAEGEFGGHRCNWRVGYMLLWDEINGKKFPWSSNPWVWALSFKIV